MSEYIRDLGATPSIATTLEKLGWKPTPTPGTQMPAAPIVPPHSNLPLYIGIGVVAVGVGAFFLLRRKK